MPSDLSKWNQEEDDEITKRKPKSKNIIHAVGHLTNSFDLNQRNSPFFVGKNWSSLIRKSTIAPHKSNCIYLDSTWALLSYRIVKPNPFAIQTIGWNIIFLVLNLTPEISAVTTSRGKNVQMEFSSPLQSYRTRCVAMSVLFTERI